MSISIETPVKFTQGAITEAKRLMNEPGFDVEKNFALA